MRYVGASAVVLIVSGLAAAQGYYPYPVPYPAYPPPLYPQPYMQPGFAAPRPPAAPTSRIPQMMAYPEIRQPSASDHVARAVAQDTLPAPTAEMDAAPVPETTPSTESNATPGDDALPPNTDTSPTDLPPADVNEPTDPSAEPVDIIKPTPATEHSEHPEQAEQPSPVYGYAPMMVAAEPAVTIVPQPTAALTTVIPLQPAHSLVNYSVPVHYPKQQRRGPWCYGDAYFLFLWAKNQPAPPLFLTANDNVVLGNGQLQFDNQERLGARFTFGRWLDCDQTCGLEVTAMGFFPRDPSFVGSNLFSAAPPQDFVATARVSALSRFWTTEVNLRRELCRGLFGQVDCLAGVRYLALDENLKIATEIVTTNETFGTENHAIAGHLGLSGQLNWHVLSLTTWSKAGVGGVQERVIISSGGPLEPLGAGGHTVNRAAAVCEAGALFGVQVNECARLSFGYTFLFISDVARPADQIDNNPASFSVGHSSYWVQGINGGFEFRF